MEPSASVARDASAKATAMDQEEGLSAVDNIVTQFNAYEDFLDSQITTMDLYYLEVRAAAPQSGHRLPASRSLRSPRVAGCSPPGGERGAAQFPAGGGDSPRPPASLCLSWHRIWGPGATQGRSPPVRWGVLPSVPWPHLPPGPARCPRRSPAAGACGPRPLSSQFALKDRRLSFQGKWRH